MFLRNIYIYYVMIVLPATILAFASQYEVISTTVFGISILVYGLIYHPLVSGYRLIALKVIKRSMLPYAFIPGWITLYFRVLFLPSIKKYNGNDH